MLLINKKDRINALRALSAPFIFLYPYYAGFTDGYIIVSTLILWTVLNDINHVLHLHIHHPFAKHKPLNILFDLSMGIVTGMTASNWAIQHKYGHHRLGQAPSELKNKWDMFKPGENDSFGIKNSVFYSVRTSWPIFYHPLIEAYQKGIVQNIKKPLNYRYAFFEQLALICFILVMVVTRPELAFTYMIPWYILVYFVTRYTDYLNHYGCGKDHFDCSNNSLNRWYNILGCNFGYHSAHHHRPSAHWSTLPQIHEEIKDQLDERQIRPYSWSGFLMPYHFYLNIKGKL